MTGTRWLGKDEHGGVPSQARPDHVDPPHWRLDAIFATPRPHHPVASPDRSSVAFILSAEGTSDIYVVPAAGGRARRISTNRQLASYWEDTAPVWSPGGARIAYSSGESTFVVDATGGPPQRIAGVSPGAWLDENRLVVVVERDRSSRLALVDVDDPWPRPFGPAGGDVGGVRPTGEGRVVAVFWPRDDFSRSDVIVADPDGPWATLAGRPDRRALSPVVHGETVAFVAEEEEWRAVHLTDLDGSDPVTIARADADFGELSWSPDGTRLAATRSARGTTDLVVVDREGDVSTVAEGGSWQTPTWTSEGIVAVEESAHTAPRLICLADGPVTVFAGTPAAIAAAPHIGFERIAYRSEDGTEIEGFLFRPPSTGGQVPAVVYPHGGPTSVYGDEWDGHAQYFVDKGYAWLAINFRGSTTYGLSFERANHDDWGVGDTSDCVAAGRYLGGLDWVDPDRVAIFGASYGSYMALAALVHPDNPFACGVAKYGDCDILTSWAQGDRAGVDDLERMMGHPSNNRQSYRAGSPIHDLDRLDRPILVAHGEQDARVHPLQAEELVAELRRLGKRYEYVTYPEEGHGFLLRDSQIDFYRRLERFLDWHLM
jgi:dipeptidyl aminopeptidase/acylaminoacyl peptidase